MKSKKIILENIRIDELNKINLHCFHFLKTDSSNISSQVEFKSSSTFYNTKDLRKFDFPKHISLLTPNEYYEKF